MNKLFTKLVNNTKLAKGVIVGGVALSTISNLVIFAGVYYMAIRKGFELAEESEENNE